MVSILIFLELYGTQLSAIGAVIAFTLGLYKYQHDRQAALFWKEFEIYHKLVEELVEPSETGLYVDRQTAILFELRNFKRYYPHTLRMLKGLQDKWIKVPDQFPSILEELDLAIQFLERIIK